MGNRATPVLLGIIAAVLCGILLRLLAGPAAVEAASTAPPTQIAAAPDGTGWWRVFIAREGRLYQYGLGTDLKLNLLGWVRLDEIGAPVLEFTQADAKPQTPAPRSP